MKEGLEKICPKCCAIGLMLYMDEKTQEMIRRSPNMLIDHWIDIDDYDKCPFCNTLLEKKSEKEIEEQLKKRTEKQNRKTITI